MRKYKLPKDQLVEPEDRTQPGEGSIDGEDVEGHGLPTTAPPGIDPQRGIHGGETVTSDDPEGDRPD
jgi:hypothetical protein